MVKRIVSFKPAKQSFLKIRVYFTVRDTLFTVEMAWEKQDEKHKVFVEEFFNSVKRDVLKIVDSI
jgi:hypothetical protein